MLQIVYLTEDVLNSVNDFQYRHIQLNIQLSQDNVVFISNKKFVKDKLLTSLYFHQIIELDSNIIGLKSFLEAMKNNSIEILLRVDSNNRFICAFLNKLLSQCPHLENIYIGCTNIFVLESLKCFNTNNKLGIITKNIFDENILSYYIQKFDIKFISFHWTALNPESINFLKNNSVMVFGHTCKNNNLKLLMESYNLDAFICNSPEFGT